MIAICIIFFSRFSQKKKKKKVNFWANFRNGTEKQIANPFV